MPCEKIPYRSKVEAKKARRFIADPALRAYKCPRCPNAWHLGHLPARIIEGRMTRGEVYPPDAAV